MGMHDGHRERRREMFLARQLEGMADHEVLELILFYAIPRRDTNELAHRLIAQFGSLEGVLSAYPEELQRVPGVGKNAAVLLNLFPAVWKRVDVPELPEVIVNSSKVAGDYFMHLLRHEQKEAVYIMLLDGKGKALGCHLLGRGDADLATFDVWDILRYTGHGKARQAILAHNHPSGVALPSNTDETTTLRIQRALEALEITLIDHLIVADMDYVSMRDSGMLME